MKIGIIGAGHVGGTLGTRWAGKGHSVKFGKRTPTGEDVTLAEAAQFGEVLLLATPWEAAHEALAGLGDLSGKILIDATNPLEKDLSGLSVGTTTSAAEQVQQWAPGARVVKAFNTVGFNIMQNPAFGDHSALLFYCGDDAAAKETVKALAVDLGFDAQDSGPLRQARLLEPLAMLWISLAYGQKWGRDFAFQVVRR